jgi:hypothetical protein
MNKISIKNIITLCSLALLAACSPSQEKQIIGRWTFETTYDIPQKNPALTVTRRELSVIEYFPNGSSTLSRRVFFRQSTTDKNVSPQLIETAADINISREWMIKDDKVISKIIDIKTTPVYLKRDGQYATDADTKSFFDKFKKPEDIVPKGQTVQVKIIALNKDKYVTEADNDGRIEKITATRTDKSLSELAK